MILLCLGRICAYIQHQIAVYLRSVLTLLCILYTTSRTDSGHAHKLQASGKAAYKNNTTVQNKKSSVVGLEAYTDSTTNAIYLIS